MPQTVPCAPQRALGHVDDIASRAAQTVPCAPHAIIDGLQAAGCYVSSPMPPEAGQPLGIHHFGCVLGRPVEINGAPAPQRMPGQLQLTPIRESLLDADDNTGSISRADFACGI